MRWTKLKSVVESLFAPSVIDRLAIHATGYGNSTWGRSWLTWDGQEFVHFSDDKAFQRRGTEMFSEPCIIPNDERAPGQLIEDGEFSSYEFKQACYRFKDMDVVAACNSQEPLLVALAALHRKLGHRRVATLTTPGHHPLVRHLAQLRLEAESRVSQGMQPAQESAGNT